MCCKGHRVSPAAQWEDCYRVEEVRPGRFLGVIHLNKSKHDAALRGLIADIRKDDEERFSLMNVYRDQANFHLAILVKNREIFSPSILPRIEEHVSDTHANLKRDENENLRLFSAERAESPPPASVSNVNYSAEPQAFPILHDMEEITKLLQKHAPHSLIKRGTDLVYKNSLLETSNGPGVIFFVHGVGGSSLVWTSQINFLSSLGYEVCAFDLIGHGISHEAPSPDGYHFIELVLDALELFDRHCGWRNVVVGHSYGTAIATYIANVRPSLTSKLILLNGGAPLPLSPQPGVFDLPICCLACLLPAIKCCFKRSSFHKSARCEVNPSVAFDVPSHVLSHVMNGQYWMDGGEIFHQSLCVATLLIHGDKDNLVSLNEADEMQKCLFGSRSEIILGASHMSMMEAAEAVNALILQFIQNKTDLKGCTYLSKTLSEIEADPTPEKIKSANVKTHSYSVVSLRN